LQQDDFIENVRRSVARWGSGRVGVFMGTSTSGILQTEIAYRHRDPRTGGLPGDFNYTGTQNFFSVTELVRRVLALEGPAATVSSACSSSSKVFAMAQRMMATGLIDAAVVGGVDSLCLTTLYGFNSLQLTSSRPCRPFDVSRDGISIGEAAAFVLLEHAPENPVADSVSLLGAGESSDAYHMSSPRPDGLGAKLAMQAALESAAIQARDVDYINLHGTGTAGNDKSEAYAVNALFGPSVPCSSTKGSTGHALGACGALEAVICALALRHGIIPGGAHTERTDPALQVAYVTASRDAPLSRVLSNSFGFGGTNSALLLGRTV
jgi:3-oxoacyl-[acyl-carrier-protein] synthase-1